MAHFFAHIQGNRGSVSRSGSKASGIEGHIRGWNIGVRAVIRHVDGRDVVTVYKTSGSHDYTGEKLICQFDDTGNQQ